MANKLFADKIIFPKKSDPSPFGTDLCCRYVTSKGFRHVVALNKPFILRKMQHFFYKINTEAARNTQTLGGKPIFSSEILSISGHFAPSALELSALELVKRLAQPTNIEDTRYQF